MGQPWVKATYLLLLLLLGLFATANAGINTWSLSSGPQSYFYEYFGFYLQDTVPFGGNQTPTINYNMTFTALIPISDVARISAEIIVVHSSLYGLIGYTDPTSGDASICCIPKWHQAGVCPEVDRVFLPPGIFNTTDALRLWTRHQANWTAVSSTFLSWQHALTLEVTEPGIWYLMGVNCAGSQDDFNAPTVTGYPEVLVTARTIWTNPFGYLPGQLYGTYAVYWLMGILWGVSMLVYVFFCVRYREGIMGLQLAVAIVFLVALTEMFLWALDYMVYNVRGENSLAVNIIGALLTSTKTVVSRGLLLLACMGYSVTRETLERREWIIVSILMALYFATVAIYQYLLVSLAAGAQVSYAGQVFIVALQAILSALVYLYIFLHLFRTYATLKITKQFVKLRLYRRLTIVLLVALVISVILYLIQSFVQLIPGQYDYWWNVWWLWDAYWEWVFFAVTITIAILWRPNINNKRYAFSVELPDHDPNDMEMSPANQRRSSGGMSVIIGDEENCESGLAPPQGRGQPRRTTKKRTGRGAKKAGGGKKTGGKKAASSAKKAGTTKKTFKRDHADIPPPTAAASTQSTFAAAAADDDDLVDETIEDDVPAASVSNSNPFHVKVRTEYGDLEDVDNSESSSGEDEPNDNESDSESDSGSV